MRHSAYLDRTRSTFQNEMDQMVRCRGKYANCGANELQKFKEEVIQKYLGHLFMEMFGQVFFFLGLPSTPDFLKKVNPFIFRSNRIKNIQKCWEGKPPKMCL